MSLVAICVMASINSCNNDNCIGNSNGIPLAGFYQGNKSATIKNLTLFGIGAPGDSAILTKTDASTAYLPLRITATSCQYVLDYNNDEIANDTITFNYDVIPYFESHECGAMYNFKINTCQYTRNAIDSIATPETVINNDDIVTIKIFMQ